MNSQIYTNKTDIVNLRALIGALLESTESSTIVTYIEEAISTAASDATLKSNQSLANAKTYSDNAVKTLQDGQVASNKANIEAIQTKLDDFQPVTYTAITEAEINGLFTV